MEYYAEALERVIGACGQGKDYLFRPQTGLYPGVIFRGFDNF